MIGEYEVGERVVFTRDVIEKGIIYAQAGDAGYVLSFTTSSFSVSSCSYEVLIEGSKRVSVTSQDIKAVADPEWVYTEWPLGVSHVTSTKHNPSQPPVRINRLLAKLAKDLPSNTLSRAESEGKTTGETTGYLLSFLGQIISNPNKWYTIRKNPYGERARNWEMDSLKGMVETLQLDFIEFRHSDKSVMFKLYEDFNGKYDLYNREGRDA